LSKFWGVLFGADLPISNTAVALRPGVFGLRKLLVSNRAKYRLAAHIADHHESLVTYHESRMARDAFIVYLASSKNNNFMYFFHQQLPLDECWRTPMMTANANE
jgi:hypothetical protein